MTIIEVANISAEVEWKNIKNVHLTIYPPNARVHVSAPIGMAEEAVRLFLITKMSWINQRVSQVLDPVNMSLARIITSKVIGIA